MSADVTAAAALCWMAGRRGVLLLLLVQRQRTSATLSRRRYMKLGSSDWGLAAEGGAAAGRARDFS